MERPFSLSKTWIVAVCNDALYTFLTASSPFPIEEEVAEGMALLQVAKEFGQDVAEQTYTVAFSVGQRVPY